MDGSLETAEETGSLVFLGGKLQTCKMERKGKTRRTLRRQNHLPVEWGELGSLSGSGGMGTAQMDSGLWPLTVITEI